MTTPIEVDVEQEWDSGSALNAGWIMREDYSLREALKGCRIGTANPDGTGNKTRQVSVYFRLPEVEMKKRQMPYIVIDFLEPVRDASREHRGHVYFPSSEGFNGYWPPGIPATGASARTEYPIPYMLHYQISTVTRTIRHDREINFWLMTSDVMNPRYGCLEVVGGVDPITGSRIYDDQSKRRVDHLAGPTNGDGVDDTGRVFKKIYTIGISSELFLADFIALQQVRQRFIDLTTLDGSVSELVTPDS